MTAFMTLLKKRLYPLPFRQKQVKGLYPDSRLREYNLPSWERPGAEVAPSVGMDPRHLWKGRVTVILLAMNANVNISVFWWSCANPTRG